MTDLDEIQRRNKIQFAAETWRTRENDGQSGQKGARTRLTRRKTRADLDMTSQAREGGREPEEKIYSLLAPGVCLSVGRVGSVDARRCHNIIASLILLSIHTLN